MRETAREINRASGVINQLWGARYFRSELNSENYYNIAYKYVYRNPVRAGLTTRTEEYLYSSLPGKLGKSIQTIEVIDDQLVDNPQGTLRWLNLSPKETYDDAIRRALRRTLFKIPMIDGRPHPLESEIY
jgi:putative transposase